MRIRSSFSKSIFFGLILIGLCACNSVEQVTTEESFEIVAIRKPSEVAASSSLAPSGMEPGEHLIVGEALTWPDGRSADDWSAVTLRESPWLLLDPMFADVYYTLDRASEIRFPIRYAVGEQVFGIVYWVDARIGLIAEPNGSLVYILEKPLTKAQAFQLEETLKGMKFDPGSVDGVVDQATRRAIGFYFEYKGLPYRYQAPVISEALLEELGIVLSE